MVPRRVILAAMAVCSSIALAACDDGDEPAPRDPSAPPGSLIVLIEHEEPACPEPCDDESPPAGDQTTWLERVQADGSGARRLGCAWANPGRCFNSDEPRDGGYAVEIAPSGRWFASTGGTDVPEEGLGEAFIHDRRGRIVDRVRVPGNPETVTWSPDERYLAMATDRPQSGAPLYLVPRGGGRARMIGRHTGAVKWSSRDLLASRTLKVMRRNGRVIHRFEHGLTSSYDWSPSGDTLAFSCRKAICAAHYNGGKRRVLTRRCAGGQYAPLAWSPDGNWVACMRRGNLVAVRLRDDAVRVLREEGIGDWVAEIDWGK